MTLRKLLSPAALALLAACAADPTGLPDAGRPSSFASPMMGGTGSYAAPSAGADTGIESGGQLGSGNVTEAAASTSPAFGSGAGAVQPPPDATAGGSPAIGTGLQATPSPGRAGKRRSHAETRRRGGAEARRDGRRTDRSMRLRCSLSASPLTISLNRLCILPSF